LQTGIESPTDLTAEAGAEEVEVDEDEEEGVTCFKL
jgi:hypothetical protein